MTTNKLSNKYRCPRGRLDGALEDSKLGRGMSVQSRRRGPVNTASTLVVLTHPAGASVSDFPTSLGANLNPADRREAPLTPLDHPRARYPPIFRVWYFYPALRLLDDSIFLHPAVPAPDVVASVSTT